MSRTIYTHVNPDLDAACSVWAVRTFIEGYADAGLELVPAGWDGEGMGLLDIAVDIEAGGKGIKGSPRKDGTLGSAFSDLVLMFAPEEDVEILRSVITYVQVQDSQGSVGSFLCGKATRSQIEKAKIADQLGLNRIWTLFRGYWTDDLVSIGEFGDLVLRGLLLQGRGKRDVSAKADKTLVIGGQVAVVTDHYPGLNGELFNRGVRVVVYVEGNNLGVCRRASETMRCDHPAIRKVVREAGEQDEWFSHHAGFLYCWGSRKNPRTAKSRVEVQDLVDGVLTALAVHDRENKVEYAG